MFSLITSFMALYFLVKGIEILIRVLTTDSANVGKTTAILTVAGFAICIVAFIYFMAAPIGAPEPQTATAPTYSQPSDNGADTISQSVHE